MKFLKTACAAGVAGVLCFVSPGRAPADVKPGDVITKDNIAQAEDLLVPAMQWFVKQGMKITVIPYKKVELPKLYKEATEKYAGQVKLSADGKEIFNYVAGLPFPNIDPNDPLAGVKMMLFGTDNHNERRISQSSSSNMRAACKSTVSNPSVNSP